MSAHDSSNSDWIREDVTVDSPGEGSLLTVVMLVAKHAKRPCQAVVIWPAGDALVLRSTKQLPTWFVDFVVRSGRAVVYPVYECTLGRKCIEASGLIAERDQLLRFSKEMRRSIDYASSRGDVDSTRVAYLGASCGGQMGGIGVAVEPRFNTAILHVAGLTRGSRRPEVDAVNLLPRIRIPVLMLSGKYDSVFPFELSQKPFYTLLGTPTADKKWVVYEGGHFLPRPEMVSESLSWLDHYLGPVARR